MATTCPVPTSSTCGTTRTRSTRSAWSGLSKLACGPAADPSSLAPGSSTPGSSTCSASNLQLVAHSAPATSRRPLSSRADTRPSTSDPPRGRLASTLNVEAVNYEIVGVMPPGFHFPELADVWVPVARQPDNMNRSAHNYPIVARRRAELSPEALDAAMATLSGQLATTYKDTNADKTIIAVPLQERTVGSMRSTLYLLLGAVALSVSHRVRERRESAPCARERADARDRVACGSWCRSVAHSPAARRREPAARGSGWCARTRRCLPGTDLLIRLAPVNLPRLGEVAVDRGVLAFAAAASVVASLVFGLVPAWHACASRRSRARSPKAAPGRGWGGSARLRTASRRGGDWSGRRPRHRRWRALPQLHGPLDRRTRLPHVGPARRPGQPAVDRRCERRVRVVDRRTNG